MSKKEEDLILSRGGECQWQEQKWVTFRQPQRCDCSLFLFWLVSPSRRAAVKPGPLFAFTRSSFSINAAALFALNSFFYVYQLSYSVGSRGPRYFCNPTPRTIWNFSRSTAGAGAIHSRALDYPGAAFYEAGLCYKVLHLQCYDWYDDR